MAFHVDNDEIIRRFLGYAFVDYKHILTEEKNSLDSNSVKNRPMSIVWTQRGALSRPGDLVLRNLDKLSDYTMENKTMKYSAVGKMFTCKLSYGYSHVEGYGFIDLKAEDAELDVIQRFDHGSLKKVYICHFIPEQRFSMMQF